MEEFVLSKSQLLQPLQNDAIGSFRESFLNPALNAGAIQPYNAIASTLNSAAGLAGLELLERKEEYKTPKTEFMSTSWFVQAAATGLGTVLPYAVSGSLAGAGLARLGRQLESPAWQAALRHRASGQILGAAVYDAMRETRAGETRFGNAASGAIAFAGFELGNHYARGLSLASMLALRAFTGGVSAGSAEISSKSIAQGRLPDKEELGKALLAGMVLNVVLPEAQKTIGKSAEALNLNFQHRSRNYQNKSSPAAVEASLKEVFSQARPSRGLEKMMANGWMERNIPELLPLKGPKGKQDPVWHPEGSAWEHTKMVVDQLALAGNGRNYPLMVSGLLHDIAKPDTQFLKAGGRISNPRHDILGAEKSVSISPRLNLSAAEVSHVESLIAQHMRMHHVKEMRPSKLAVLLKQAEIKDLIELQNADSLGRGVGAPGLSHKEWLLAQLKENK